MKIMFFKKVFFFWKIISFLINVLDDKLFFIKKNE